MTFMSCSAYVKFPGNARKLPKFGNKYRNARKSVKVENMAATASAIQDPLMANINTNLGHSVGSNKKGKKQRHLKLYIHPPSIPTKFQTFHFDDREDKAFNSTAPRFDKRLDELPGPGYYQFKKAEQLGEGVSLSQKGYTNGFVSKSKRLAKPATDLEVNLPTHGDSTKYTPRNPVYSYSVLHNPSPAFRSPLIAPPAFASILPTWGARFDRPSPGPGHYAPERIPRRAQAGPGAGEGGGKEENGARSAFMSKSRRTEINEAGSTPGRDAPAPGMYEVEVEGKARGGGGVAAFKATARPNVVSKHTELVPGPGTYNLDIREHLRGRTNRPGPSTSIAAIPLRPTTPLSNQYSVPGSNVPPISNPGPGMYDLALAADNILRKAPTLQAAFVSASPRFASAGWGSAPGPGFYKPIDGARARSYRLNLEGKWA
ncbi:hypothetical protein DFS34DRAFT_622103 [Phlyctochytrium arcticum]|nr:hypothetical protein DFS34DRAFT_622103 [Phlyctochytrium arcticum]